MYYVHILLYRFRIPTYCAAYNPVRYIGIKSSKYSNYNTFYYDQTLYRFGVCLYTFLTGTKTAVFVFSIIM